MCINQYDFGRRIGFVKLNNKHYNLSSKIKGVALHFALENYLKYNNRDDLSSILLNNFGLMLSINDSNQVLASVDLIISSLKENKIIIDNSIIKCEVSFINKDNRIMRIDCLIENDDCLYILDYKSSDFDLENKKNQICKYLEFIRINFNKNVKAYLCFADGKLLNVV